MISLISFLSGFINTSLIPGVPLPLVFWILIGVFIFRAIYSRESFLFTKSDFYFFIFWLVVFISVFLSKYKSIIIYTQLINITIFYFMYFVLVVIFRKSILSYDFLYRGVGCFLAINGLIHLIGFYDSNLGRNIVTLFNNSGSYSLGGIYMVNGSFFTRLGGVMPEPSFLSAICAINICLFSLVSRSKINFLFLIVSIFSLILSEGRTGIAAVLIFMSIIIFSGRKDVFYIFMVFFVFLLSFSVLFFVEYLVGIDDSFRQRFSAIIYSIEGVKESPFFGNGFGAFQQYSVVMGLDFKDIFFWPMNLLYSSGVFGFIFFYVFVLSNFEFSNKESRKVFVAYLSVSILIPSYNFFILWVLLAIERLRCKYVYNS